MGECLRCRSARTCPDYPYAEFGCIQFRPRKVKDMKKTLNIDINEVLEDEERRLNHGLQEADE